MCQVPSTRLFSIVSVVVFVLSAWAADGLGQNQTARPERGTGGKGTQAASEIDSINLQNGNMSLQIPLATLPRVAGGKLSYTLNAYYNSSLWDAHRTEKEGEHEEGCPTSYNVEYIDRGEGSGWRIGGQYRILFRDAKEDFSYIQPLEGDPCAGYEYLHMDGDFFRPVLVMPDGSEHELRIDGSFGTYAGLKDFLKNYYKSQTGSSVPFTSSVRMYTVDGTYIVVTYSSTGDYKIYLKDGTQIENATGGQRIKDTNGNSILISSSGEGSLSAAGSVKDEHTQREIKWSASTYNSLPATKVEYQSLGGTWQSVWVVWGSTEVTGRIFTTNDWDPNAGVDGHTCEEQHIFNPSPMGVVRQIVFPQTESGVDPQKYLFEYNSDTSASATTLQVKFNCVGSSSTTSYTRDVSGMGEISQITTPTGAEINYTYVNDTVPGHTLGVGIDRVIRSAVTQKNVVHDGITDTWDYDIPGLGLADESTVTNPDGSQYKEYFYETDPLYIWSSANGFGGLTYRSVSAGRVMTEKIWSLNGGSALTAFGSPGDIVTFNPVVDIEYTSLLDQSGNRVLMKATAFEYDYNGELTKTTEYDWFSPGSVAFGTDSLALPTGVPGGATVLRVTNSTPYNKADGIGDATAYQKRTLGSTPDLLGYPKEITVGTTTTPKSTTHYSYDGQSYGTAPTKGNATTISVWDDSISGGQWLNTGTTYTTRGNVETVTDPEGNVTEYSYGAISSYSDLYSTQVVAADNTAIARTSTTTYDFSTGLVTLQTDEDNDISVETNYDILLRPTRIKNAVGTPLELWTVTQYSDSNRRVIVKSDLEVKEDGKKIAIQHFDQLGRVRLSRTIENPATEDPTNEQHGIKIETRYKSTGSLCPWDNSTEPLEVCTYSLTSNPFRAATASAASGEETMGWTLSLNQNDGRRSEVQSFTGAAPPAPFASSSPNTSSTGTVKTTTDANATTVEDQAGKLRRSIADGLGRLVRVDEPNGSNVLGAVATPNQPTGYAYDVLGNLLNVTQEGTGTAQCGPTWVSGTCTQTRTFTYTSLSRLKTAANPESGTINYVYDKNGNLTKKTDARGVETNYVHDELNRVTERSYATPSGAPQNYQATPTVTYTYGTAAPKVGRLTKVESSVSTTEFTSFDILGRVTASKQTTDGITYGNGTTDSPMTYTYDLAGNLIEQQYPSGRRVQNTLDATGDLEMVKSRKNASSGYWAYANNFTYNAAGVVTSMQLGNGTWESTAFNSRLQPTQIVLGTVAAAYDKLKLNYTYGDWVSGSIDEAKNNGNVVQQMITVPTVGSYTGFIATQKYYYDSLNRIDDSTEDLLPNGGPSTQTWQQDFGYDRFGNRSFNEPNTSLEGFLKQCSGNTVLCPALKKKMNPAIDPANNRIVEDQDSDTTDDYRFDDAGNTTKDPNSRKFTYDGENKQVKVETVNSSDVVTGTVGEYWYDGDGKRVKKFVPDTGEVTIFVYDAANKLVAEYSTSVADTNNAKVAYLTNDHLGSPRINSDKNGNVIARHDYHPFGEEIATSQRVVGLGYADDTVRKQFTGYERDGETELDFAEARMYASGFGRFTTPDPLYFTTGRAVDPQQINLFIYGRNNPVRFTDPDGLDVRIKGDEWEWALKQLGDGLSFKIAQSKKGGLVQIVDANGKALDAKALEKLKDSLKDKDDELTLFTAITDTKNHAVLNAVRNDDNVDVGSIITPGENGVDRPEVEMLAKSDGEKGFTTQNIVRHEVVEAWGIASGQTPQTAHTNNVFPGLYPVDWEPGPADANGMVSRVTTIAQSLDDLGTSRRYYQEKQLAVKTRSDALKKQVEGGGIAPKGSIVSITYK